MLPLPSAAGAFYIYDGVIDKCNCLIDTTNSWDDVLLHCFINESEEFNMQIVVAGRQASTRRAISLLIRTRLGLETVGEASEVDELMSLVKATQADLVLLDEGLPGAQLSELVSNLREHDISPAVIVLNGQPEAEAVALAAGANAFVYKGDRPKQLLIAIESIQIERQG